MKATRRHKKRFRDNLRQFIELKKAGKLNGSAAQIKQKLKAAADVAGLDFTKEFEKARKKSVRDNPVTFIETTAGKLNFGEITAAIAKKIKRQAGYIRLTAEGLEQVESHEKEIKNAGFDSVIKFAETVAGSFDAIYADRGALLLTIKNKPSKLAIVRLEPFRDEDFYVIKSALPVRSDYLNEKELLWDTAQSNHRKNATPGAISGHNSSETKDTKNPDKRGNPGCGCDVRLNPEVDLVGIEPVDPAEFRDNPAVKPDEIYQMITDMVINTIEKVGHLPWQKEWEDTALSSGLVATNFVSGNAYRGINFFMLNFRQVIKGDQLTIELINYDNPYFLTFNQIEELGGTLQKGSYGKKVVYFTKLYQIDQKDPELEFSTYSLDEMTEFVRENYDKIKKTGGRDPEQIAKSRYIPILKYYNVFHAGDIDGIDWGELPKNENASLPAESKIKVADAIYDHFPKAPEIRQLEARAYYLPELDYINMPPLDRFSEEQFYHTTLFHEAVHATGHKSRVGRDLSGRKGNQKYAFEELIAEMGAVFLCAESGILFRTLDNSAKYLKGWNKRLIKNMKDDNRFFFRAASRAQQAADYILDRNDEGVPAYRSEVELETSEPVRTNPETDTVCLDDITCEVTVKANTNAGKGGIEIRFSGAPPEEIREQLKDHDFWFYTPEKADPFWAGQITAENKAFAESLAGRFDSAVLKGRKKNDNGRGEEKPKDKAQSVIDFELGDETTVDFKADGSIQETGDYAIVEVSDLQASHNKDCSVNSAHQISRSQPRDRSKEALCAQPQFIAKNLNPASITQGNLAFVGAPAVNEKAHTIQGNGRSIALKIAYDEIPKSAKRYKKYLLDHAAEFGFSKSQVNKFDQPVLVRMLPVDKKTAIELGNVVDTSQAKMSKIDQAKAYIRNLSENQLQTIGRLIQNSSGETIGAIIDDAGIDIIGQLTKLDRTEIVENGQLTAEGKDFLRSVLVGLVFDNKNYPNALHHYLKLPHRIKAGLERSFGYIIPLIGNKGDITGILSRSVEIAAQTYQSDAIQAAKEYAGSKDMFEEKNFSKNEVGLAQFFLDAQTQKEIRDAFGYYDELLKGKENLFGKVAPKSKKEAFSLVFVDRARPNPGRSMEEVIHQTIVRAQRLENFGHDNSAELDRLNKLLGRDGWKWNEGRTQIIRGDSSKDRHQRLVTLEEFRRTAGRNANLQQFTAWLQREYPKEAADAEKIWYTIRPGSWRTNPALQATVLTDEVKRAVLDDFFGWMQHNPLMDYNPGPKTFENWIHYHYPGFEARHEEIWARARPVARQNPPARFIWIGLCEKISIDQGKPRPVLLQGPLGMLTNKSMNKLFIVPLAMMDTFNGKVEDLSADQVYSRWHHFAPDSNNYSFNWPSYKESYPVGSGVEIFYISDKVMRQADSKGDMNTYHHTFDPGKRPCVKKGNILIVNNLEINKNGILN